MPASASETTFSQLRGLSPTVRTGILAGDFMALGAETLGARAGRRPTGAYRRDGWGGQQSIRTTQGRIRRVREMITRAGKETLVGVDGGITRDNMGRLAGTDVDLVIAGSAIFEGRAVAENWRALLEGLGRSAA